MPIKELSIDIETYCEIDLRKSGVYRYAEDDSFELLLFAVSVDNGPVTVYDLTKEKLPQDILENLVDDSVIKWAFNASFERICLSNWLKKHHPEFLSDGFLSPVSWRCSMIWSAYLGLPLSLEGVGTVLKLKDQKMREGADLIRYFCLPCKPTKVNGGRIRNFPHHAPNKWSTFIDYNRRDVEVELAIKERVKNFPVPSFVWNEYHQDQIINDRGIGIDLDFVKAAINLDANSKAKIQEELKALTGLENPNSVLQMIGWLREHGVTTDSLDKKAVKGLLKTVDETTAQVLKLRQQAAKSSVSKYQAMMNCVCKDGRARGMFQFYGANRTGRWAGRLVQLQNLPQNHLPDLEEARELFGTGDLEATELIYDTQDTLSQLIRTAFVPSKGKKFIVCDFSAIEARVLSHLAGERWRSKVFEQGKDIYCMSASQMFGVPVEKHGQNSELRQKGKIAELACGYGGSVGALKAMGAIDMGLSEDELQPLVNSWRQANPNIVLFWWDVDKAVKIAVEELLPTSTQNIQFEVKSGILFITLPSGRQLAYVKPKIGENQFGGESVTYEGTGTAKRWERLASYGPKFVENIVQAISRDILAYSLEQLKEFKIVGHVHDEVIIECPMEQKLDKIASLMGIAPDWMSDINLRADGYECSFYQKD
ncbi:MULTISPECIES: DNA polymerase [Streptococcus]|jgi:DNA polymerase|uniref:DNA polymerase n=1 Tax=Streptococcus TaxID=1301 RepID=UPI000CF4D572|nr:MULTISPECIES: DNA polymerase [Streptococcus]QGJ85459.1 DNA polymerase I [Streptococcus phage phi-SsuFJNP3_rum]QGJ85609.1 DNA polymerase I [Streptococcus phage phi-SsuFJNP9_rum]WAX25195.1 XRE family transcriptional regulator [Streptococcus phage YS262]WAX25263.1 XRE family transcriptional regulator [Streptococcus phage YS255]WAX25331.1 XRE family transcriptional regulator [Streptococcus phage YS214]WAX25399.1 XRE family transcriptional regulator [Streptococcus phage YS199]HEN0606371.1 DNA 